MTSMLLGGATPPRGPERLDLGEDPFAELVAGTREGEGRVGVQALQPAGPGLPADPARELRAEAALLLVGRLDARAQLGILPREPAPTLDPACRLLPPLIMGWSQGTRSDAPQQRATTPCSTAEAGLLGIDGDDLRAAPEGGAGG